MSGVLAACMKHEVDDVDLDGLCTRIADLRILIKQGLLNKCEELLWIKVLYKFRAFILKPEKRKSRLFYKEGSV